MGEHDSYMPPRAKNKTHACTLRECVYTMVLAMEYGDMHPAMLGILCSFNICKTQHTIFHWPTRTTGNNNKPSFAKAHRTGSCEDLQSSYSSSG